MCRPSRGLVRASRVLTPPSHPSRLTPKRSCCGNLSRRGRHQGRYDEARSLLAEIYGWLSPSRRCGDGASYLGTTFSWPRVGTLVTRSSRGNHGGLTPARSPSLFLSEGAHGRDHRRGHEAEAEKKHEHVDDPSQQQHIHAPPLACALGFNDAQMFTHGFGRILVGQSVCTVVGLVLHPCDAMDGQDRGTPGSPLSQEMGMMQQAFAYPFMYWVGMNTPPDTDRHRSGGVQPVL
jgi:hypothetical protein